MSVKANYIYDIVNGVVEIIDLNLGNMSVTNDAEAVLTEINETEYIEDRRVIYKDSEDEWSEIIPSWSADGRCVNVSFRSVDWK